MSSSRKIWGETKDGKFEFVTLTDDLLNDALEVIRLGFFPYESVSIATDVAKNPEAAEELLHLCRDTAKDGVSIVAIEKETGVVASVAFNKIQRKCAPGELSYFEKFSETCKHTSSIELLKYMLTMDSKCDLFEHYKVDVILEIMFLCTLPKYTRRSLGKSLCETSFKYAQQLPKEEDSTRKVQLVSALPTSVITQRILCQLEFDFLFETSFDEFIYEGKKFSSKIGPITPSSFLTAKRVM